MLPAEVSTAADGAQARQECNIGHTIGPDVFFREQLNFVHRDENHHKGERHHQLSS